MTPEEIAAWRARVADKPRDWHERLRRALDSAPTEVSPALVERTRRIVRAALRNRERA